MVEGDGPSAGAFMALRDRGLFLTPLFHPSIPTALFHRSIPLRNRGRWSFLIMQESLSALSAFRRIHKRLLLEFAQRTLSKGPLAFEIKSQEESGK